MPIKQAPHPMGWILTASGLHYLHDSRGKVMGGVFKGLLGWWSTLGVVGSTWKMHRTEKAAKTWVIAGGEA